MRIKSGGCVSIFVGFLLWVALKLSADWGDVGNVG